MIFTDIRLQNYRSYNEASFDLGENVNIVVGPNTAGKTNLLEALMVCSVGRSYKANDRLLINNKCDWCRVDVHTSDNQLRTVKINIHNDGKTTKSFELDNKVYKKLSVATKNPVVLFQPEDLNLFYFEPSARRDYIDNFIDQYTPGHAALVNKMKRTIAQRNRLLKQPQIESKQLFTWNIRLCEVSNQVVQNRTRFIDEVNKHLTSTYSSLAGKKTQAKLSYNTSVKIINYSTDLLKKLEQNQELDKLRGFTSHGPHRDDINSYINEISITDSASRGENRSFILSLKIIELKILEEKTNKRPLLLLDDVFSELDGARRRALTNYLSNYQTVITTTDADAVMQDFADQATKIVI